VFTSSMSVCATDDGGEVNENCSLVPDGKSPSTDRCVSSLGLWPIASEVVSWRLLGAGRGEGRSVCTSVSDGEVNENCPLVPDGKSPSTDRNYLREGFFWGDGGAQQTLRVR
jgi:hypothetical protein